MANRSRCTAFIPCSLILLPSHAMSCASGTIGSPTSSPPPPEYNGGASIYSASHWQRRQKTQSNTNYVKGLYSKVGKVRFRDPREGKLMNVNTRIKVRALTAQLWRGEPGRAQSNPAMT